MALFRIIYSLLFVLFMLCACSPRAEVPVNAQPVSYEASIYPDYKDIVIPVNIAPLNLIARAEGDQFVISVEGEKGGNLLAAAGKNGKLQFEESSWHTLLKENAGGKLQVTLYARNNGNWVKYPAYLLTVAPEDIDPYLNYRLIEPGYELYRQMGIYERNLTNFKEIPVYENGAEGDFNHCVNCHNFQQNSTRNFMFHVREKHGGTVFVRNGKADKRIMTNDSILGNAVYPSWHPTKPWIVFSSNMTSQVFHLRDKQKTEVIDSGSDLIFYDVENHTVSNILKTNSDLENFPCWTPDGKSIYYCSARVEALDSLNTKDTRNRELTVRENYKDIRYNLMRIDFDETTQSWGEPQMVLDCAQRGLSVSVPRVSPDGRYILLTLGEFGQFHIWHKSSDLYVWDIQKEELLPLEKTNSADVDSYHSWSSNGRWMVFSSRRDDGSYTRPYIAYFDKEGNSYKAFMLPQEDPEDNLMRLKSYNVPELTKDAIQINSSQLRDVIYADEKARKVAYK